MADPGEQNIPRQAADGGRKLRKQSNCSGSSGDACSVVPNQDRVAVLQAVTEGTISVEDAERILGAVGGRLTHERQLQVRRSSGGKDKAPAPSVRRSFANGLVKKCKHSYLSGPGLLPR
jgi:hypothetical protein